MNRKDEDQLIKELYQKANQEQPPEKLDDIILRHAQNSQQQPDPKATAANRRSWRPWLAAASVVLVLPMIWLLTQNQALRPETSFENLQSPIQEEPTPLPTKPVEQAENSPLEAAPAFTSDTGIDAEPDIQTEMNTQDDTEYEKIKVTGSRLMGQEAELPTAAPMLDLENKIEQQTQRSISGQPINQESLEANKTRLMNEFKAKKRRIKPSTMDPLMLLEYEQFGRYLDVGNIEAADQLLTEMQENWPDFDFEDMIYRLAEAEVGNQ